METLPGQKFVTKGKRMLSATAVNIAVESEGSAEKERELAEDIAGVTK